MKKNILIFTTLFGLFVSFASYALTIENPLQSDDVADIVKGIWKVIFTIAIAVVPLMAIVAGFMFMTAGGNPEKVNQAKKFLLWLVVGTAIILLAGGIVQFIRKILGV